MGLLEQPFADVLQEVLMAGEDGDFTVAGEDKRRLFQRIAKVADNG